MSRPTGPTRKVVIVGGGTAGWITANIIAAEHPREGEAGVDVVLVESPDIPTIGVGEGTWPSMRVTLRRLGLAEDRMLRACNASFKQGTRFFGWAGRGGAHASRAFADEYIHPFSLPTNYASENPAPGWLAEGSATPFAHFVTPQARVIERGLAPKQAATPQYAFAFNYGYHLDAGRFATLLRRHAVEASGVTHVQANVERVASGPGRRHRRHRTRHRRAHRRRSVRGLHGTARPARRTALRRRIRIGQGMPVQRHGAGRAGPRRSRRRHRVRDPMRQRCRRVDLGHRTADAARCRLRLLRRAHGSKRGADNARTLREAHLAGAGSAALDVRTIPFEPGYRKTFWTRNCVAVGLSAGFVEPLEASALALIEQSASAIAAWLPRDRRIMDVVAKRFNAKMRYHWERIVEFLKLHYAIGGRDEAYWRDHRVANTSPESLRDKLVLWQQQPPWHDDAPRIDELFPSASYQYVLYGLGFVPKYAGGARKHAAGLFQDTQAKVRQAERLLPTNRALLCQIAQRAT